VAHLFSFFTLKSLSMEMLVASRLFRGKRDTYVSMVSLISIAGLALGVASLILILAVTSGFEAAFRDKLLGVYPHMVVIGKGGDVKEWQQTLRQLEEAKGIVGASPATYDEMMASRRGQRSGAIVKGVYLSSPYVRTAVGQFLVEGSMENMEHPINAVALEEPGSYSISTPEGGSTSVLVLSGDTTHQAIPLFAEEKAMALVVNATGAPLPCTIPGLIEPRSLTLASGEVSQPFGMGLHEDIHVLAGDEVFTFQPSQEALALVIYRTDQRLKSATCYIPRPGNASEPATLCVVNGTTQPLALSHEALSLTLDPQEVRLWALPGALPGVLLGKELAEKIEAKIGDEVRLVSPLSTLAAVAGNQKSSARSISDAFVVVGLIHLGFYEYDMKMAVVGFNSARRFLHQGSAARWVEVQLEDLFATRSATVEVGRALRDYSILDIRDTLPAVHARLTSFSKGAQTNPLSDPFKSLWSLIDDVRFSDTEASLSLGSLGDDRIITWEEMNEALFTSMKRQKIVLSLFFLIVIFVAAFNVVSSQVMVVREKSADISMLKAMGATRAQIRRAFLWQGLAVGLVGVCLGLAVAGVAGALLELAGFPLDPQVYFVSELPVELAFGDFLWAGLLAVAMVYLSVALAASKAGSVTPVEGLRNLE